MVYQIDDTTAVASQPALPTDSIGTPGFFTGGSTSGGAPTRVRYWWLNMVQQELLNIALAAGLTADKTDNTQCITAIKALAKQAASGAVLGSPGVLATGDVAGSVLYYSAALAAPAFTYGSTTVGLATTTALTSALGNYLPLTGGILSGDLHRSGDAGTNRQIFLDTAGKARWAFGADAANESGDNVGSDFFLSRFDDAGDFIDTPVTAERSTGVWAFKYSPRVPDVVDFTTQGALGARVAEARYVRSVPAASSGNIQIADIEFDASGNVLVTDAAGNVSTFYKQNITIGTLNGLPCFAYTIGGNLLVQEFYTGDLDTIDGSVTVLFPTAFVDIPAVTTSLTSLSNQGHVSLANMNYDANDTPTVTAEGIKILAESVYNGSSCTCSLFVRAIGRIG
ncbi:hypothetical protein ACM0P6_04970 [Komagataeibacter sucrofermentans]|uniref:Tail fiber protein n=1 Tax=Komagataeibacter sucrofermentans TaxID=1053551 RepID=A0A318QI92_9PROT|nr:hypothetical protein [Komagataeibacter sucrofermentans]PYD79407.1 hypothetical protein CFR77_06605 [Komagataeibacter sucrofermentans]GBQ53595.1 hypothetical protein AA15973_3026 [Komagataeibacter sucrofermentans DSM 15973]